MLLYTAIQNSNPGINLAWHFAESFFFCMFVFTRCLTLACQLKAHLLLIALLAKALFSWQINMAALKNNIPPKLPIGSSEENSGFEICFIYRMSIRNQARKLKLLKC